MATDDDDDDGGGDDDDKECTAQPPRIARLDSRGGWQQPTALEGLASPRQNVMDYPHRPSHCQEAGIPSGSQGHRCPLCRKEDADEGHLFWECPKVCQNPGAVIQTANRYGDEFRRNGLGTKRYWLRGLQPRVETTPVHQPQGSYEMLGKQAKEYT